MIDRQQITILLIALTISASGIVVNLFKKAQNLPIHRAHDQATLFWFRLLVPLSLVLALACCFGGFGTLPFPVAITFIAYGLVVSGLAIRWAAILSLGRAFTVQVVILEGHRLKTDGLYHRIRHPSYTGLLLYYLGLGLLMHNWISLLLLVGGPLAAVVNRIRQEELVLLGHFQDTYRDYQAHSWRLFPYLY